MREQIIVNLWEQSSPHKVLVLGVMCYSNEDWKARLSQAQKDKIAKHFKTPLAQLVNLRERNPVKC